VSQLTAIRLKKRYKARTVVHDVSLEVASGEVVGLLGPNGAGKTTCFYMIVGLVGADAGNIALDGDEVWTFSLNGTFDQQEAPPLPQTTVELAGNPVKLGTPMGATNSLLGDRIFTGNVRVELFPRLPPHGRMRKGQPESRHAFFEGFVVNQID